MKTCSRCKENKPYSEYGKLSKAKDGLQYYCIACKAKIHQDAKEIRLKQIYASKDRRVEKARNHVYDYLLNNPCDCGESDPVVLEFDHNDGVDKESAVSTMVLQGMGFDRIDFEIAKCTVRCANCHRRRTAEQFQTWRWKYSKENKPR